MSTRNLTEQVLPLYLPLSPYTFPWVCTIHNSDQSASVACTATMSSQKYTDIILEIKDKIGIIKVRHSYPHRVGCSCRVNIVCITAE